MKKATKTLLLMLCAVVLVVSSILGTVAYLTDTKEVTNTFTVGKVAITLQEKAMNEETGELEGDTLVNGIQNIKFVPGREIKKCPVITVGTDEVDSENCWLFVKVENGDASKNILGNGTFKPSTGWIAVPNEAGWYRYNTEAANDAVIPVFDYFTCANIGNDATAALAGASIKVTAYAIQSEGVSQNTAFTEAKALANPAPTNP